MNGNRILAGTLSAFTLFFAGAAVAAEPAPHSPATGKKMEKKMDGKMSCDGMMGMMGGGMMGKGMMGSMMGSMMNGGQMMAGLPPGNEKLNMQMQAEMMQAMGTIMQKYADKISIPAEK